MEVEQIVTALDGVLSVTVLLVVGKRIADMTDKYLTRLIEIHADLTTRLIDQAAAPGDQERHDGSS